MGLSKAEQQAARASELNRVFDFLVMHPEGVTLAQIAAYVGKPVDRVVVRIKQLREVFAKDPETVVCEPAGLKEAWIYRIVSTYEDTRWWSGNRVQDMESRLATMVSVAASVTNMTDPKSTEGKKARKIARTLEYLEKELAEIAA